MLKLNDMVIVKNDKGEMIASKVYERVYLAYGPKDEVETKDVTVAGKSVGTKVAPKGTKSVHDPNELVADAIAYLQATKPNSDPWLALLGEAEYGFDLQARQSIRQSIAPSKPVDIDKAMEKAAKIFVSIGAAPNLEAAIALVRSMKEKQEAAA